MGAVELLSELRRRGLELQVRGDRLRYRPRSALTPDLAQRVQAHKVELLALLAATEVQEGVGQTAGSGDIHFTEDPVEFCDVCAGWKPLSWAGELRRKADRCDGYRPDIAAYYRDWADEIERRSEASE